MCFPNTVQHHLLGGPLPTWLPGLHASCTEGCWIPYQRMVPLGLHAPVPSTVSGTCQAQGSSVSPPYLPLPLGIVLAPSRCSGGIGETEFTGENTETQRGQDEPNTPCLVRNPVGISLLSLLFSVSLLALGSQHHLQPTNHLSVCSTTHVFLLPNPSFRPYAFFTSCPIALDQQVHWKV